MYVLRVGRNDHHFEHLLGQPSFVIFVQTQRGCNEMATQQSDIYHLLERATAVLPVGGEDLVYKGIATAFSERILTLKKATSRLQAQYGSVEELESRIHIEGLSPDDHTPYADLLEWRAARHELAELFRALETI